MLHFVVAQIANRETKFVELKLFVVKNVKVATCKLKFQ